MPATIRFKFRIADGAPSWMDVMLKRDHILDTLYRTGLTVEKHEVDLWEPEYEVKASAEVHDLLDKPFIQRVQR